MSLEDEIVNLTGAVESIDSGSVATAIQEGLAEIATAIREGLEKVAEAAGPVDIFENIGKPVFTRDIEHVEVDG